MLFSCSGKDINVKRIPKRRTKYFNIRIFRSNHSNFSDVNNQARSCDFVLTLSQERVINEREVQSLVHIQRRFHFFLMEMALLTRPLMERSSVVRTFTLYGLMLCTVARQCSITRKPNQLLVPARRALNQRRFTLCEE